MNEMRKIYVFGDQAVPYEAALLELFSRKQDADLVSLFEDSYRALVDEIRLLPPAQQARYPPSSTITELLIRHRSSQTQGGGLGGAFACLHQLAAYISYCGRDETCHGVGQSSYALGICLGLLAASAVSCSRSLADIISLAPKMVVTAFRLGHLVQQRSQLFEADNNHDGPKPVVVSGISVEDAGALLDNHCRSRGLSRLSCPYVSAVGSGNITISGPSSALRDLLGDNPTLKAVPVPILGLFHSPFLYNDIDIEHILHDDSAILESHAQHMSMFSDDSASPVCGETLKDLLTKSLSKILVAPLRWDTILQNLAAMTSTMDESGWVVYPFATGSVQSMAKALSPSPSSLPQIRDTSQPDSSIKETTKTPRPSDDKIAIIGFSGRFPEADDNEEFWRLLMSGLDVHKEIPKDRFDAQLYCDPSGRRKNTSGVTKGCFIRSPGLFDTRFFGLSPREAEQADPAQRLALMTAYEAIEMAGLVPDATPSTQRNRVGVFYGTTSDDWREVNSGQNIDTYFIPGGNRALIPGRINYHFKFSGPSYSVDTACSSSLAAIHIGCNALWRRDCDTAIAGGTNIMTNPDNFAGLDRGHFLSRTGNCNTFDDAADGYCRADCVGTVVLKRLKDARADGDPIFATILGTATNHSAEAVSITRPHSGAQEAIFRRILAASGVDQSEVGYIEMHGTGTQHGDAVEMQSVLSVFSEGGKSRSQPLYLGSAKSSIGHAESSSGIASLIKVLLMIENSKIPPHVGIKTAINRNFPSDLGRRNVHIAAEPVCWETVQQAPRRAFINNFSAAGGNSSVLLEEGVRQRCEANDPRPLHVVAVSAKNNASLHKNIAALRAYLGRDPPPPLASLSYTTTARRIHHGFRVLVSGNTIASIEQALGRLERKDGFSAAPSTPKPVAFCFTGQGSQYHGMGRQLLQVPQFRANIEALDSLAQMHGFPSFLPLVDGTGRADMAALSAPMLQLSITCLQMALAKYWRSLGITPELTIGHRLGEYAAMNASGILSDSDAIWLVGTRAKLLETHCTVDTHAMLAAKAPARALATYLGPEKTLEVACINGPQDTVISGLKADVAGLAAELAEASVKTTQLNVQFAFHSAQVVPMLESFRMAVRAVCFNNPTVPMISPLLKKVIKQASDLGCPAEYLSRHCQEAVDFAGTLQAVTGIDTALEKLTWLEIGPHPVCSAMLLSSLNPGVKVHASLKRSEDNWATVVSTLGALYEDGARINWPEYHHGFNQNLQVLRLPAYAWDLKNYWISYKHDWCLTKGDPPLALRHSQHSSEPSCPRNFTTSVQRIIEEQFYPNEASVTAVSDVSDADFRKLLQGHRVNGQPLCTSSAYADMALTLFNHLLQKSTLSDKDELGAEVRSMFVAKPLILDSGSSQHIKLSASVNWITRTAAFNVCSISPSERLTTAHASCVGTFSPRKTWLEGWRRQEFLVKSRIGCLHKAVHDDSASAHCVKSGMFYKLFSCLVDYEAGFKGYREAILHSANYEATGKVRFTPASCHSGRWFCNPYWIDSIGQITGFTLNANDNVNSKDTVFINHGWENLRIAEPLVAEKTYETYVKMQEQGERRFSGDVYVLDAGRIVAVYEGVTFAGMDKKVLDMALPNPLRKQQPKAVAQKPRQASTTPSIKTQELQNPSEEPDCNLNKSLSVDELKRIIAGEVGLTFSEIDEEEELTSLGIDSLLSLTLAEKIREELGIKMDSNAFIDGTTVKELCKIAFPDDALHAQHASGESTKSTSLLDALQSNTSDSSDDRSMGMGSPTVSSVGTVETEAKGDEKDLMTSLTPLPSASSVLLQGRPQTASKMLWLFPDGSGLASSYLKLPEINPDTAVFGLNSPFVRKPEAIRCTLRELTTVYVDEIRRRQPHGPYYLGGWSAGGICAYDAAQTLIAASESVSRLILLDSPNPVGLEKLPLRLYDLFDSLGLFGEAGRKPPAWLLQHFLSFIDVLDTYKPIAISSTAGPETFILWAREGVGRRMRGKIEVKGDETREMRWLLNPRECTGGNGWEKLVGEDKLSIEVVDGEDHFSMLQEGADKVCRFLRRAMQS